MTPHYGLVPGAQIYNLYADSSMLPEKSGKKREAISQKLTIAFS